MRPSPGVTIIDSPRKFEQVIALTSTPPIVTVEAPYPAPSSPRSPRLSGLLDALKDVIGDDPEAETLDSTFEEVSPYTSNTDLSETWGEPLVTEAQDDYVVLSDQEEDTDDTSPAITFSDDGAVHSSVASVSNGSPFHSPEGDDADQGGIEDIKPTVRHPSHTRNYSDVLPEPPPEYAPKRASHRRSTSMPGLNRPSLNRPLHLQLDSLVPSEVDSEAKDTGDFIDSGYAESWQPPSPLALASPRTPSPFDPFASSFCSPSIRMHSQPGTFGQISLQSTVEDETVSEISVDCTDNCPNELQNAVIDAIQLSATMDNDVAKNDVRQSSSIATISARASLGARAGEEAEPPAISTSYILNPPPTSKAVAASIASELLTSPKSSAYHDNDGQLGSGTLYAENASAKEPTSHQDVSSGSTEVSDTPIHEENSSAHALKAAVAVLDLNSVSHDHTPNLTEDVGDDDNASSRSSQSSAHLAYDVYSHVSSPPGDAEHSSMLLHLESSPSFSPPFSDVSSNILSPGQAIIASAGTQKLAQASSSSTLSPVESLTFSSSQDRGAVTGVQSPDADGSRSSTSSSAPESRKVPFGWRFSGKPQVSIRWGLH